MRRSQVNLAQARVWVARLKNSLSVEQPIAGDELRALKRYLASREDKLPWLFISERGQPMTRQAVNYLVARAAEAANLGHLMCAQSSGTSRVGVPSSDTASIGTGACREAAYTAKRLPVSKTELN